LFSSREFSLVPVGSGCDVGLLVACSVAAGAVDPVTPVEACVVPLFPQPLTARMIRPTVPAMAANGRRQFKEVTLGFPLGGCGFINVTYGVPMAELCVHTVT
jgi:hypothetical protein